MSPMTSLRDSLERHPPSREEARRLLSAMQWSADLAVQNPWGNRVWLRPSYGAPARILGVTDCCLQDDPCPRHLGMSPSGVLAKFEWRRIDEMSEEEMYLEMLDLHNLLCYGVVSPRRTERLKALLDALEGIEARREANK